MPNSKGRRRRFGAVRRLPSGQWQARYRGPDGLTYPADTTFPTKTDAEVWLTRKEAEILDGDWINPEAGKVLLTDFGAAWIEERPNLRPNTVLLYGYLLRRHIAPYFAAKTVGEIKEAHVRRWRRKLLDSGVSEVTTAKAYRLLRAILNTAADDGMIRRNPCRIKGAGQEESAERPVLTIPEVYAIADAIDQRYRVLILLAAFTSLRWAELAALRPSDVDLETCTVRVHRQLIEQPDGRSAFGPPKSKAGKRTVTFPAMLTAELREHLAQLEGQGPEVPMFTSPEGMPLRHRNFRLAAPRRSNTVLRPRRARRRGPAQHRPRRRALRPGPYRLRRAAPPPARLRHSHLGNFGRRGTNPKSRMMEVRNPLKAVLCRHGRPGFPRMAVDNAQPLRV